MVCNVEDQTKSESTFTRFAHDMRLTFGPGSAVRASDWLNPGTPASRLARDCRRGPFHASLLLLLMHHASSPTACGCQTTDTRPRQSPTHILAIIILFPIFAVCSRTCSTCYSSPLTAEQVEAIPYDLKPAVARSFHLASLLSSRHSSSSIDSAAKLIQDAGSQGARLGEVPEEVCR